MTAVKVADDILKLAKRKGMSITPMQLMKLVYISYGWHLAMHGRRLFDDRIEAWKYGPVIPNLYRATRHFGRDPIPHNLISDAPLSHPDLETFLGGVVEQYGKFSGIALSNLTHRVGTPWSKVYRDGELHIPISDQDIRDHYLSDLNARQPSAPAA